MQTRRFLMLAALLIGLCSVPAHALDVRSTYIERQVRIPMRDGATLVTRIYTPPQQKAPLPILLMLSPYAQSEVTGNYGSGLVELMADEYIVVVVSVRGREGSEGDYQYTRPILEGKPGQIDYTTDIYDSIEWLLRNVPANNGRVGLIGSSYRGYTTLAGLIRPHPALQAAVPIASMADMWVGDDNFHNGAPRSSYVLNWYWNALPPRKMDPWPPTTTSDLYQWYLDRGDSASLGRYLDKGVLPAWDEMRAHPHYDEYWQSRSMVHVIDTQMSELTVPTLAVAGWWDQEDLYGSLASWSALQRKDSRGLLQLVIGPWYHAQWRRDGKTLGDGLDFGEPTATRFREAMMVPWLAHLLKDRPAPTLARVTLFRTGENTWTSHARWPLVDTAARTPFYFSADRKLSREAPQARKGFDRYVSDPSAPVPYQPRPIKQSQWGEWMARDQRFAAGRPDILYWQTEPLDRDVLISGEVSARLFASTSGTDMDWVVKLIDVYPDPNPEMPALAGYQLMVVHEIHRAKYRRDRTHPAPLTPGKVESFDLGLGLREHTFRKGHRILVQLQSSLYPLYEMNPQTFVENSFVAERAAYRIAENQVHRTRSRPSHILLPIVQEATSAHSR